MIRVLQFYPQLNNAGTERVIINLYENVNREEVQFDFLVEKPGELDDYIRSLGANIHYLQDSNKKNYYKRLIQFFNEHQEYKVVHTHTHAWMDVVLKAAKKCKIPCRVAHSHNARNDLSSIMWFIKGLTSIPMEMYATHFFACSSNAAKWLFPHRVNKCKVLYNGINLEKYLFNNDKRIEVRNKLDIKDDEFVFVHVGRFAEQKNHEYLVSILKHYNDSHDKWKALLIGCGPLEDDIKKLVKDYDIEDKVLFLGNRTDVNELLSASDCFVFPSLHEGLGIVVIEAQTTALPCIVSTAVPKEADLNLGLLKFIDLKESFDTWVNAIDEFAQVHDDRELYKDRIINSDYNIRKIGKQIEEFYKEMYENE